MTALQKLMRHQSFTTTLRYINDSQKMREAVDCLTVPAFLQKKGG